MILDTLKKGLNLLKMDCFGSIIGDLLLCFGWSLGMANLRSFKSFLISSIFVIVWMLLSGV